MSFVLNAVWACSMCESSSADEIIELGRILNVGSGAGTSIVPQGSRGMRLSDRLESSGSPSNRAASSSALVDAPVQRATWRVSDESSESAEPLLTQPAAFQSSADSPRLPLRPRVLDDAERDFIPLEELSDDSESVFGYPDYVPPGYAGASSIWPSESPESADFTPVEDRWRIGFPSWDRYQRGHPWLDDYPYVEGRWWDPYHQNVLKGDYPIRGQNLFLNVTAVEQILVEGRQVPTPTTPYESTSNPNSAEFFGDPNQFFSVNNLALSFDLTHGNGAFRPPDWRLKVTQIFNMNYLDVHELAVVNPDVRAGTSRFRSHYALEEWFFETKIADLSPSYDFVSVRGGSQFFTSDFRGFVFADINRMVRVFGNQHSNRHQFNVAFVDQTEKDTNSLLNTFDDRHQNTVMANYYVQDFIWPGYTVEASYHFNRDQATFLYDRNGFLVRPDPVGVYAPHEVRAHYLGFAGDGHINRFNVSHAFYWALGRDELNPLAGTPQSIDAKMAALELSYDRDWMRFRTSYFYSSGDDNVYDNRATGFDTIFDSPIFAGGPFSYWQRQQIKLFGVNLVQRNSLVPDLRSSKAQGQTNFVNPGLQLANVGVDFDLTPRLRLITNVNALWFDQVQPLETLVFQPNLARFIGVDMSVGAEYRPLLNNQIVLIAGLSALAPGQGFRDLYNPLVGDVDTLMAGFVDAVFAY